MSSVFHTRFNNTEITKESGENKHGEDNGAYRHFYYALLQKIKLTLIQNVSFMLLFSVTTNKICLCGHFDIPDVLHSWDVVQCHVRQHSEDNTALDVN